MKNTRFEENKFWLGEVIETLMYFKFLLNGLDCMGFHISRIKFKWPMLVSIAGASVSGTCGLVHAMQANLRKDFKIYVVFNDFPQSKFALFRS